jgi:hypothetical protein
MNPDRVNNIGTLKRRYSTKFAISGYMVVGHTIASFTVNTMSRQLSSQDVTMQGIL